MKRAGQVLRERVDRCGAQDRFQPKVMLKTFISAPA
jgi:hypothetical protein